MSLGEEKGTQLVSGLARHERFPLLPAVPTPRCHFKNHSLACPSRQFNAYCTTILCPGIEGDAARFRCKDTCAMVPTPRSLTVAARIILSSVGGFEDYSREPGTIVSVMRRPSRTTITSAGWPILSASMA